MKIRFTLEVSKELRRWIAAHSIPDPQAPERLRTADGLATREAVIRFIGDKLDHADDLASDWVPPDKPTATEESDVRDAVEWLVAAGRTEEQIVRWIVRQRAIADYAHREIRRLGTVHVLHPDKT